LGAKNTVIRAAAFYGSYDFVQPDKLNNVTGLQVMNAEHNGIEL
jgi:hypothetical protein